MKMRDEYTCPLELTHDAIKGKWKPIILWQLSKAPQSLSGLRHSIAGISQKMLIQHLNELIHFGFVVRTTFEGYPLKVEYDLTDRGRKIFDAITIMQAIGIEMMVEDHKEELLKARGLLKLASIDIYLLKSAYFPYLLQTVKIVVKRRRKI